MQKALAPSFKKKTKMEQKDKQLIQDELSAMFQYGVKCKIDLIGILNSFDEYKKVFDGAKRIRPNLFDIISNKVYTLYGFPCLYRVTLLEFDGLEDYGIPIDFIKPYLRPISSMTNEEINKLFHILKIDEENTKEWIKVNERCRESTNQKVLLSSFQGRCIEQPVNAKEMETLVLKENSPKIRATLALYNIECCTCCNFNGAVWLNYQDDITHIVHGKGYTDDLFPSTQQEELDRFVAETKNIYYCKDVNEFIEKIKEQQNER